jgi:hypothetical protein
MGETARKGASQSLLFLVFLPIMRDIMDLSWYNVELEAKYLSEEELDLLKKLRSY